MNAVARAAAKLYQRVTLQGKPLAEPEPVYGRPRPVVGLFAQMTPEEQKAALAYRGPEYHGDETQFRLPEAKNA